MKSAYGIDIGNAAVKCIRLVKRGRHVRVASFSSVPIEGEDGERSAVAQLAKEHLLAGRKVAVSLPASLVHIRNIDSPPMRERVLRSTIKSQVEPLVPIDIDSAVVDYMRLSPSSRGEAMARLLVAAAPKTILRGKIDLLKSAGLRPTCLGIDAIDSCVAMKVLTDGNGRALLVDLGARTCNLVLTHDAALVQARACRLGAEGLQSAGAEGIERYAQKIAGEITRMVKGEGAGQADRILVTGGGSMAPGVMDALARLLESPVSTTDLSARFMPDADEETRRRLNSLGFAAFGAAYSRLFRSEMLIDLQREEFGRPGVLLRARRPLAVCAIALFVVCLVGNGLLLRSAWSSRERLRAAEAELESVWRKLHPDVPLPPDIAARIRADQRQLVLQNQSSLVPERQSALDLLLAVVKLMPREKIGEVRRVDIAQESIRMDMRATSFSAAQDIAESINRNPQFSAGVKDLKPISDNAFAFQLVIAVRGAAPHE